MIRSKNITKTWKLDKVAEVETRACRKHQQQPVDTYKRAKYACGTIVEIRSDDGGGWPIGRLVNRGWTTRRVGMFGQASRLRRRVVLRLALRRRDSAGIIGELIKLDYKK